MFSIFRKKPVVELQPDEAKTSNYRNRYKKVTSLIKKLEVAKALPDFFDENGEAKEETPEITPFNSAFRTPTQVGDFYVMAGRRFRVEWDLCFERFIRFGQLEFDFKFKNASDDIRDTAMATIDYIKNIQAHAITLDDLINVQKTLLSIAELSDKKNERYSNAIMEICALYFIEDGENKGRYEQSLIENKVALFKKVMKDPNEPYSFLFFYELAKSVVNALSESSKLNATTS